MQVIHHHLGTCLLLLIRKAIIGAAHPCTKAMTDRAHFVISMADTYPCRAPAQKLLSPASLLTSARRDGARPRPRRRRRPPPLLSLRVLLLHHRSSHPGRSPSSKLSDVRLDLPSSSRARHRGPRRRALGDHAAGQGVAGA